LGLFQGRRPLGRKPCHGHVSADSASCRQACADCRLGARVWRAACDRVGPEPVGRARKGAPQPAIAGNKPPRGHDSNLTTFHKITDFRTAAPRHVAVISGGSILRQELTQHAAAPLGSFIQGTTFAGAALANPVGLGQAAGGEWFDLNNWHSWNRPDATHEIVTLGSAITADRALTLDRPFTM